MPAHRVVKHFPEERARLLVVVVRVIVDIPTDFALVLRAAPGALLVLDRAVERVRLIVDLAALIAVDASWTISDIVGNTSAVRAVDRNLLIVGAKTMPVSVRVGEETALEHFV